MAKHGKRYLEAAKKVDSRNQGGIDRGKESY